MAANLDSVDLRLLVNIKRARSLTGAARASNISLSAASVRIKKMEATLSTQILYRESDGVRFTSAGLLVLDHADLVLQSDQALVEKLRQMSKSGAHILRVRATSTLITEILPPRIEEYLSICPNVHIEIEELLSEVIVGEMRRGDADVGIASTVGRAEGLVAEPYYRDELVLIVPEGHALAGRKAVWFSETLRHDFVGLGDFSASHRLYSAAAAKLQLPYNRRTQVGSFEAACCMVAARIGLSIVPRSAANRYSRTLSFSAIVLNDDWAVRDYWILQREGEPAAHIRKFVEILLTEREALPHDFGRA